MQRLSARLDVDIDSTLIDKFSVYILHNVKQNLFILQNYYLAKPQASPTSIFTINNAK